MKEVYCSECGKKNLNKDIYCKDCGSTLKTEKLKFGNKINSFDDLINEENYQILYDTYFTPHVYNTILDEITRIAYDKFTYDENKSALENVYHIVEQYVKIYQKHKGSALGYYTANEIFIDERLPDAEQIATLIHELTHHLYAEIYEQMIMYALGVEKSPYIEAFVLFSMSPPALIFLNEYIAHTTEGQFILHGCQNYGSFIQIMNEYEINPEDYKDLISLGRAVSNDITQLLEYFIDENLRKRIIKQYTIDNVRRDYEQIKFEETKEMMDSAKTEIMGSFIRIPMKDCLENPEYIENLEELLKLFK